MSFFNSNNYKEIEKENICNRKLHMCKVEKNSVTAEICTSSGCFVISCVGFTSVILCVS